MRLAAVPNFASLHEVTIATSETTAPSTAIRNACSASANVFAGSSFCAVTTTVMTAIQARFMTPSATGISINARLEPTQHSPYARPELVWSRQRRRDSRLNGVNS